MKAISLLVVLLCMVSLPALGQGGASADLSDGTTDQPAQTQSDSKPDVTTTPTSDTKPAQATTQPAQTTTTPAADIKPADTTTTTETADTQPAPNTAQPSQTTQPAQQPSGDSPNWGPPTTTTGPLQTTSDVVDWQKFRFDTTLFVSPYDVAAQRKLKELDGRNVFYASLRHHTMQGNRANDLQPGYAPKGTASSKLCYSKDGKALIDKYCDNQVVFLLTDQPISINVKSQFITQVREIVQQYFQQCPPPACASAPPPCPRRFRLPGSVQQVQAHTEFVYEQGLIQLALGFNWLTGGTTNNVTANGGSSCNSNTNTNNNGNVNNNTNPISVGVAQGGG